MNRHILIDVGHARLTGASGQGFHEHEEMEAFAKLWLAICEKREMLGTSGHLVYICKKK